MNHAYHRDRTYSGDTQDMAFLVEQAHNYGAASIKIMHKSGTTIAVTWDRDGEELTATGTDR
jgi:hypothetical protein